MLSAWASSPERLVIAVAITLAFALLAKALRGVSWTGALGGGLACLLLLTGAGPSAFVALATLFLLTWLATRFGHARKLSRGLAERREGRGASQVLANLAVSAAASVSFSITGNRIWLVALVAGLAEAACDTVASEVGQSSGEGARLITNWTPVQAGVDGGITLTGSVSGLAAALAITSVSVIGGLVLPARMWIPIAAGFAGMLADSLLGATLQRRGRLSNRSVNLLATLAAAVLACFMTRFT